MHTVACFPKIMYFFMYPACSLINTELFPGLPQPAWFSSSHNTVSVSLSLLATTLSVSCPLLSAHRSLSQTATIFHAAEAATVSQTYYEFPSTIVSVFAAALEGHSFSPLADFPPVFQTSSHIILPWLYCPITCQTTCSFFSELLCRDSVLWFCTCLSASTFFPCSLPAKDYPYKAM